MESVILIAVLHIAMRISGNSPRTFWGADPSRPLHASRVSWCWRGTPGRSEVLSTASLTHAFAPLFTHTVPSVLSQPWALSLLPRLSLALWVSDGDTPRAPKRGGRARQGHWISAAVCHRLCLPKMDARQWSILLLVISARLTVQREASTTSLI